MGTVSVDGPGYDPVAALVVVNLSSRGMCRLALAAMRCSTGRARWTGGKHMATPWRPHSTPSPAGWDRHRRRPKPAPGGLALPLRPAPAPHVSVRRRRCRGQGGTRWRPPAVRRSGRPRQRGFPDGAGLRVLAIAVRRCWPHAAHPRGDRARSAPGGSDRPGGPAARRRHRRPRGAGGRYQRGDGDR